MAANLAPFRSSSDAAALAPPPPTPWYITLPPAAAGASRAMPSLRPSVRARLGRSLWAAAAALKEGWERRRRRQEKMAGSNGRGGAEERGERGGLAQFCEAAAVAVAAEAGHLP